MGLVASVHQFGHHCKDKKNKVVCQLEIYFAYPEFKCGCKKKVTYGELTFEKEVRVVLEGVV